MTYIPPLNGGRINATISGNTAGAGSLVSTGTLTLAGGNNITLSQNGNAITISGGAGGGGSNTLGMSNLGNTSGTTGVISGSAIRMVYAGGNNVTLSQSINASSGTITISAANQTVQTQNLHNLSLAGNTTGTLAQVSSGTLLLAGGNNITLSQNGNSITISGGAGGAGGGIALANSQTTFSSGTANLVASGALTIASTTGQSFNFSVPQTSSLAGTGIVSISVNASTISIGAPAFSGGMSTDGNTAGNTGMATNQIVFAGGNNITLSQATGAGGNTLSIIGGAGGGANTMDYYQNMDRGATAVLATSNGTVLFQRLNQENDLFAANITANTIFFNMSASMNATSSSSAHSYSMSVGIYTDNITALSLINSASSTWALGANTANTASYHGVRWISFVSSQWSAAPVLQGGGNYVFAVGIRNAGLSVPMSYIGQNFMISIQRSGSMGTANTANITMPQGNFWNAMYNSNSAALPVTVISNQVNRNNAMAIFIPHIILNNRYSGNF
jgi:hypothetical protein